MVLRFMWKKAFLLHGTYLQKMLRIYIYVFDWFYFTYCLTSFSSIDHFLCLYSRLLMLFHLRKMRFFQPTHLLMFDFNVHQKDWITYAGGTDRPGELLYFFLSQMTLLRRLTLLLGSLTAALRVLLFWISFFLLTLVFAL